MPALGGGLPQKGLPASEILAQLDEIGGQGVVASAGPPVLRFRHWRRAARVASRELALCGMGSERVQRGELSGRRPRSRQVAMRWVARSPESAGGRRGRVRHRGDDGQLHRTRRGPGGQFCWRTATTSTGTGSAGRRRRPWWRGEQAHATLFKALGMLGLGRDRVVRAPGRRARTHVPGFASRADRSRRSSASRRGNVNSGAFRSGGRGVRRGARERRLGPRGRRVRAVGESVEPVRRANRRCGARRFVGDRRPTSGSTCHTTAVLPWCATPGALAGAMSVHADYSSRPRPARTRTSSRRRLSRRMRWHRDLGGDRVARPATAL